MDLYNDEVIYLRSEKGEDIAFIPIAQVTLTGKKYLILQPEELLEGMDDDEALVFEVSPDGSSFAIVLDDDVIDRVFDVYDALYEASAE